MSSSDAINDLSEADAQAAAPNLFALMQYRAQQRGFGAAAPIPKEAREQINRIYAQRAKLEHRKGNLPELLRQARVAKRAAAQAAARARAALSRRRLTALRSRLPSLLSRARRHRPARRSALRTCRPSGRKKRHRGRSPDDIGRRSAAVTPDCRRSGRAP
jgi:hypothetical protein